MTEEGIEKIKAWSAVDNIASKKVLEKTGFIETEIIEASINVDGLKYDQIFFETITNNDNKSIEISYL